MIQFTRNLVLILTSCFYEIGHALGLDHQLNENSFMNANPYHMYSSGIFNDAFMKNHARSYDVMDRQLVRSLFPDDKDNTFANKRNIDNLKKHQCIRPEFPVCKCPNGIAEEGETCRDEPVHCVVCDVGYHLEDR